MRLFSLYQRSGRSMRQKLFRYMLTLAAVLLIALSSGLFLFGRFNSTEKEMADVLGLQAEVFSKDIDTACEEMAATGIFLSEETSRIMDEYLSSRGMQLEDLNDNSTALHDLQDQMIETLRQMLMQTHCSGAYILLDATVNSDLSDAGSSRSGLYLQRSEAMSSRTAILLYRGISDVGKAHGAMPHRKWRLEFRTDLFPEFESLFSDASLPLYSSYRISDTMVLPGTSEQAALLSVPIIGSDGTLYGICGFEISQSYFQMHHAQPTRLPYLTCLVTKSEGNILYAEAGLSCGIDGGYYFAPHEQLSVKPLGSGLSKITGGAISYVGVLQEAVLAPHSEPFMLTVMTPKSYYDHARLKNALQLTLLFLLLLFFTVSCCIYFSHRFLTPVLKGLEQLKSDERSTAPPSGFQEIDDLFGFLAEKDLEHESALESLRQEKNDAQSRADEVQIEYEKARSQYETARTKIAHLSGARDQIVDPEEYDLFLQGIKTLTPTEREIFGYYLQGHNVKEILEIAGIKESTLRYHNRNIYSKLNVNSLKQLLQYAALLPEEYGGSPPASR